MRKRTFLIETTLYHSPEAAIGNVTERRGRLREGEREKILILFDLEQDPEVGGLVALGTALI